MASKFVYFALICLVSSSLSLAQSPSTPTGNNNDELRRNPNENTNFNDNGGNQQNNQIAPSNELVIPDQMSDETDDDERVRPFNFNPFQFFQRRLFPIEDLIDQLRRQRMSFDHQFSQLERQAGQGQDVSYFSRNGEQYVRTCVTKKVQPGDQKQQVPQSSA